MLAALLAAAALQSSPPLYFERTFDPSTVAAADRLDGPTDAAAIPGDDRIFVTEQKGRVRIIRGGQLRAQPFADLDALFPGHNGLDLVAMTFHPDFDANGFVYLWCGARSPAIGPYNMTLGRITVDSVDPDVADPTTWVELLRVPLDANTHFGGRIAFGSDAMLWIGIGDGASLPATSCSAQDMGQLAGKMIRIDVDAGFPYVVPPDNPFVGVPGVASEIVHSGLRHPWKWSFDGATGDLWIGEIGQYTREEVNFAPAGVFGLNFGWPAEEGTLCNPIGPCTPPIPPCGDAAYTDPVFEYPHGTECAVTGGEVYYGSAVPWLVGWYLCADLCTNQMWRIRRTPLGTFEVHEQPVVAESPFAPGWSSVSFARDGFGELLYLEFNFGDSMVRRLRGFCGTERICDGAVNAAGTNAGLRWIGPTSLSSNDASIFVTELPAFSPALLFYGPLTDFVAMGNGNLCVGGALIRAGVAVADGAGTSQLDLDLDAAPFNAAPGQIEPGSTWTFQAWYRDVGGPLGAAYNFSSASSVTFCP